MRRLFRKLDDLVAESFVIVVVTAAVVRDRCDSIFLFFRLLKCSKINLFLFVCCFAGVIYGFKGLILVFGLFLAYETRSIKVKQINDSRYVGMSIYNIAVLCLITAPVAMVIASQQDASFVFVALAVIFCCFLSMLLIFVPKVSKQNCILHSYTKKIFP